VEDGTDGRIAGGGREGDRSKERLEWSGYSCLTPEKRVEPTIPESPSQTSKSNFEHGSVIIHRLDSFPPTFM